MIFKEEFQALVNRYSVNDYEKDLMQFAWDKAENVFQGKGIQDAVLLKDKPCVNSNKLSQAELQFLTKQISFTLMDQQHQLKIIKSILANAWTKCDKENPETALDYKNYRYGLTLYKQLKNQSKKLQEIQRKLKKQAGE